MFYWEKLTPDSELLLVSREQRQVG
jgi:hypothetical protein